MVVVFRGCGCIHPVKRVLLSYLVRWSLYTPTRWVVRNGDEGTCYHVSNIVLDNIGHNRSQVQHESRGRGLGFAALCRWMHCWHFPTYCMILRQCNFAVFGVLYTEPGSRLGDMQACRMRFWARILVPCRIVAWGFRARGSDFHEAEMRDIQTFSTRVDVQP